MHQASRFVAALAVFTALVLPVGCASSFSQQRLATKGGGGSKTTADEIVIDGQFDDWPRDVAISSDEHFIYLRVKVEQSHAALQASRESLVVWLDLDNDAATGLTPSGSTDLRDLGVDLAIEFSPRTPKGPQGGIRVTSYDSAGTASEVNHSDLGLHFAPSYASEWTEMRFARRSDLLPALSRESTARAAFALFDDASQLVGWSDPIAVEMRAGSPPPLATVDVPAKPEDAIRVMSWNALRDAPTENPAPFARVFQAIDPDIVLIQEWDADAEKIEAWFNKAMRSAPGGDGQTWTVRDSAAWGVAIASKHPIQPLGPDALDPRGGGRHPTRFVGAVVVTPLGDVAAGSVHLKCCGSAGSREDETRRDEAFLINETFSKSADQSAPGAIRVIGGDLNLVGSRQPLDALRTGLDEDGRNMLTADPRVLGDNILATWGERESRYSSGRLDWVLYGDQRADLVQAFVLDTSRLSEASLNRVGLQRGDTAASDHNPVVVDLKPSMGW